MAMEQHRCLLYSLVSDNFKSENSKKKVVLADFFLDGVMALGGTGTSVKINRENLGSAVAMET